MIIAFDLNGVFFNNWTALAARMIAAHFELDQKTLAFVLKGEFAKPYRTGKIEPALYWEKVREFLQLSLYQTQMFRSLLFEAYYPIDEVIEIAEQLRGSGFVTAYLSNMPKDKALYLQNQFAFMNYFDYGLCSYETGVLKPSKAFFREFMARFAVEPRHVAYIDDGRRNVEAARALGMTAFMFETAQQLRADLFAADLLEQK